MGGAPLLHYTGKSTGCGRCCCCHASPNGEAAASGCGVGEADPHRASSSPGHAVAVSVGCWDVTGRGWCGVRKAAGQRGSQHRFDECVSVKG